MAIIKPEQLSSGLYSISGSFSGSFQGDGSQLSGIISSSYALTASYVNPLTQSVNITGSLNVNNTFYVTSSNVGIGVTTFFSGSTNVSNSLDIGSFNQGGHNLSVRGYTSIGSIQSNGYGAIGSNYYLDNAGTLRNRFSDSVSIIDFPVGGFRFLTRTAAAPNTSILGTLTELMRITSAGLVGIGTITPTASLHISGASASTLLQVDSPASSSILFVTGSGRVGIGTNNPLYKLEVASDTTSLNGIRVISQNNSTAFEIASSLAYPNTFSITKNNAFFTIGTSGYLNINSPNNTYVGSGNVIPTAHFHIRGSGTTSATIGLRVENTNASASLIVNDAGNVAIGKDTANAALDVSGSAIISGSVTTTGDIIGPSPFEIYSQFTNRGRITLWSTNTSPSSPQVQFLTNGTARMTIVRDGNIGIGTSIPSASLHVIGTTLISGSQTITGSLTATGGITGSLFGTASWAGNAQTASYAPNFANTNLTFTSNREHNTNGNVFQITTDNGAFGESFIYMSPSLNEIGTAGAYTDYTTRIDHFISPAGVAQRISSTGVSIGLGASDPLARLHVRSSGATSTTTALRIDNVNSSASLTVLDDGSVGIGILSPTSGTLHVGGNVFATSFTGSLLGTASYSSTSSYVNPLNQNVSITGSLDVSGSISLNGNDIQSLMIAYAVALG